MNTQDENFHPGEIVRAGGVYECDCDLKHTFSTDMKGYPFPPLPDDCDGTVWRRKSTSKPR